MSSAGKEEFGYSGALRSDSLLLSSMQRMVFYKTTEFSRKGRIWVLWSPQVRLTPVFKSDQMITVSVLLEGEQEEFFCSCIYAENTVEQRRELWEDTKSHQSSPLFRSKEWIVMGDFNEILEGEEHSSYQDTGVITACMRDFESAVQYCHFPDMGFQGPKLTWCNRRGCSNHLRGRFHLKPEAVRKRRPFKFTNVVAEMPEFLRGWKTFWRDKQPLFQSTSALFRFYKALKALKLLIRSVSKEKLGDLTKKVKEAYQDLCEKQEATLKESSQAHIQAELITAERWQRVSGIEEKILKQRSKLHWLQVGDKNNKAFHKVFKIREARNAIREIKCVTGQVVSSQEDIKS
ncbi:hypothetical protein N665_0131s0013 [Sinapis alba]|nr:hypothetical protein N665_0131s0013 [Sinapis alba]